MNISSDQNQFTKHMTASTTDTSVIKCARFFKTLLGLSSQQNLETVVVVRRLIKDIIYGNMTPEDFRDQLQKAIKSQAQGNLLPFLYQNMPSLRSALHDESISSSVPEIMALRSALKEDNISSPSLSTLQESVPDRTTINIRQIPQNYQTNSPGTMPFPSAAGVLSRPSSTPSNNILQIQNPIRISTPSSSSSFSIPREHTFIHTSATNSHPLITKQLLISSSPKPAASSTLDDSIEGVVRANSIQSFTTPNTTAAVVVVQPQHQQPIVSTVGQRTTSVPIPHANPSLPPPPPPMIRVPTNLPNMLLNPQAIAEKIYAKMPDAEVDPEVYSLISNVAESRLSYILAKLIVLSGHRLEPLRQNPGYQQIDDPRRQLRFVEDIDKAISQRHEALEREAILRITKSKGKDKDTIERAKQIQKADREATMNRETNEAAFLALGGSKASMKRKALDQNGGIGGSQQFTSDLQRGEIVRAPRIKRITIRDLEFFVKTDNIISTVKPSMRHRIALSSINEA